MPQQADCRAKQIDRWSDVVPAGYLYMYIYIYSYSTHIDLRSLLMVKKNALFHLILILFLFYFYFYSYLIWYVEGAYERELGAERMVLRERQLIDATRTDGFDS